MIKKLFLAAALAGACISGIAAPSYYVVVPVPGKLKLLENITVTLNSITMPEARVGVPYTGFDFRNVLTVTGDETYAGTGVTFTLAGGSLPAGLSLSSAGVLSGTPTAAGTPSFTLKATYRTRTGEQLYSVFVHAQEGKLSLSSSNNFGSVVVANTSTLPVTVSNLGDGPVKVTGATSDKSVFTVDASNCQGTLAPSQTCRLNVSYTPTSAGATSATLTVSGNSGPSASATLTGSGLAQTRELQPSPATINFGSTPYGSSAQNQSVTLRNNGNSPVNITSVSLVGGSGDFSATNTCGSPLSPNGTCTINVGFTPSAKGGRSGSVSVQSNTDGGALSIALSGTGLRGVASVSPVSLAFGNIIENDASAAQAITVTNSGDYALSVTQVGFSATGFTQTNNCGVALAPSGSCTIYVTFRPTGVANYTSNLAITNTGPNSVISLPLSGSGTPRYSYAWTTGGWSTPSACGSTTQTRSVTCQRSDGASVADSFCTAAKPASSGSTTDYRACSYAFSYGGWSPAASCGTVTQTRTAVCMRADGTAMPDSYCGTPVTSQTSTDYAQCTYSSGLGNWGSCSASCGGGTQTRSVSCTRSDNTSVSTSFCGSPATSQSCNTQACAYTYAFEYGAWSAGAQCGTVNQTRSAVCKRSDGATVANSNCGTPVTSQTSTDYAHCTYSTGLGNWGSCSASCGGGTQTRSVSCTRSDNTSVSTSFCGSPATSQSCNTQACAYTYAFEYGGWSAGAQCGTVTQTRSAVCKRSDGATVADSNCGTPVTSQTSTDYAQCTYSTGIGNWGSCSASCGGGTQTRSVSCTRSDNTSVSTSFCGSPATSQSCNTQSCVTYTWSAGVRGACYIEVGYLGNQETGACSTPGATRSYYAGACRTAGQNGYYLQTQTCQ